MSLVESSARLSSRSRSAEQAWLALSAPGYGLSGSIQHGVFAGFELGTQA